MSSELENLPREILEEIVNYAGIRALGHLKKTSKGLNQKLSVESLSKKDIIDFAQFKGMRKFIGIYQKTESYKKLEQAHDALKKLNPQDLNENQQQTLLAYIFVTDDIKKLNPGLIKKLTLIDDAMRRHVNVVVAAVECNEGSLETAIKNLPPSPRYFLNLSKANLNHLGGNLRGANLEGACLCGANLSEAYLEEANLEGANLIGNLDGANLKWANLRVPDHILISLIKSDLYGAYLRKANLEGTVFITYSSGSKDINDQLNHWVKQTEGHKQENELRKAIANDLVREATKKEKKNPKSSPLTKTDPLMLHKNDPLCAQSFLFNFGNSKFQPCRA